MYSIVRDEIVDYLVKLDRSGELVSKYHLGEKGDDVYMGTLFEKVYMDDDLYHLTCECGGTQEFVLENMDYLNDDNADVDDKEIGEWFRHSNWSMLANTIRWLMFKEDYAEAVLDFLDVAQSLNYITDGQIKIAESIQRFRHLRRIR